MSPEMERAACELAEARASYKSAEHNLAVARANLTRAERNVDRVWRGLMDLKLAAYLSPGEAHDPA